MLLNQVLQHDNNSTLSYVLFDQVLNSSALNNFVTKRDHHESWILWATDNNMKCWSDNWEEDLIILGFAQAQNESQSPAHNRMNSKSKCS